MSKPHITYRESHEVYLEGKRVGDIIGNTIDLRTGREGYCYFPKGSSEGGDVFPTPALCKASLEAE
jgi:hypothetical protein